MAMSVQFNANSWTELKVWIRNFYARSAFRVSLSFPYNIARKVDLPTLILFFTPKLVSIVIYPSYLMLINSIQCCIYLSIIFEKY